MELREILLGSPGTVHIRSVLQCGNDFSRALLSHIDFSTGRLYSPLPEGTTLQRAWCFSNGGLTSRSASLSWLGRRLSSILAQSGGSVLVLEDSWAQLNDLDEIERETAYRTRNGAVLHLLASGRFDQAGFERLVRSVTSFQLLGAVSTAPIQLPPDRAISASWIQMVAKTVDLAFCDIYDQEGLLIWEANPR